MIIPADYEVDVHSTAPNMTALLGRALLSSFGRSGDELPKRVQRRNDVAIDKGHVAEYAQVCGFRIANELPPTYLHMLAFPLSMAAMVDRSFPFALPGLVHVANRIHVHRPVSVDERADLSVAMLSLRDHPKGRQFDIVARVDVDGERVWESASTYLKRGESRERVAEDGVAAAVADVDLAALPVTAEWNVPSDIGRRYGAVSGDRNPIHLSALSARPFGFPTAIAHGMWSAAYALAALEGQLPDSFVYDVAFRQPVRLPAKVLLVSKRNDDGFDLGVRGRDDRPHLTAKIARR